MTYQSDSLLESLQTDVRQLILAAERLRNLDPVILVAQPSPDKWSVAQVLQHLNGYSNHYLNAIEEALHLNPHTPKKTFQPGWLGNYFTRLMKPTPQGTVTKKMQAPKTARPQAAPDAATEMQAFLNHQHRLLNLLQLSRSVDIGRTRIPTSLSKLLKLRLGDTFRFVVAHEQRHFVQIERTLPLVDNRKPAAHTTAKEVA